MTEKLPNFFIAGAVKSGSTSLYHYLNQHPDVYMSPIKEPHFFSAGDMDFSSFRPLIKKRVQHFNLTAYLNSAMKQTLHRAYIQTLQDYRKLFKNVTHQKAIGEASTSYLWSKNAPQRIKELIPMAKIIILLRNPVERAFSHYLMDLKINLVQVDFADALKADQSVINPSWGKNSMYIQTGMYTDQVRRFYNIFDENQLMIVLYDELKDNTLVTVQKIYRFLEIDETFTPDLTKKYNAYSLPIYPWVGKLLNNLYIRQYIIDKLGGGFKAPFKKIFSQSGHAPAMRETEKVHLTNTYLKEIVNLQQFLGKDLSNWLK